MSASRGKFVIALDWSTAAEQDAITNLLQEKGWEVWHWLANLWLVTGVSNGVTPCKLTTEIHQLPSLRGRKILVMSTDGESVYWGSIAPDAWSWMAKNWGAPDQTGFAKKDSAQN